jgi:hypothetical protein
MTTRRATCSCGQLHLTIEAEPSRISMCHCLECQRRTGAVMSNQARFRHEQVTFADDAQRAPCSFGIMGFASRQSSFAPEALMIAVHLGISD